MRTKLIYASDKNEIQERMETYKKLGWVMIGFPALTKFSNGDTMYFIGIMKEFQ